MSEILLDLCIPGSSSTCGSNEMSLEETYRNNDNNVSPVLENISSNHSTEVLNSRMQDELVPIVVIRSHLGTYLQTWLNGDIHCSSMDFDSDEMRFEMHHTSPSTVAFKNLLNKCWLSAEPHGKLICNRSNLLEWGQFELENVPNSDLKALRTHHGKYICCERLKWFSEWPWLGNIIADRLIPLEYERFSIVSVDVRNPCIGTREDEFAHYDAIPLISQMKSAVEAVCGENDRALRTQIAFSKQCVVVSQVRSILEAAGGDCATALETQKEFLGTPIGLIVGATLSKVMPRVEDTLNGLENSRLAGTNAVMSITSSCATNGSVLSALRDIGSSDLAVTPYLAAAAIGISEVPGALDLVNIYEDEADQSEVASSSDDEDEFIRI